MEQPIIILATSFAIVIIVVATVIIFHRKRHTTRGITNEPIEAPQDGKGTPETIRAIGTDGGKGASGNDDNGGINSTKGDINGVKSGEQGEGNGKDPDAGTQPTSVDTAGGAIEPVSPDSEEEVKGVAPENRGGRHRKPGADEGEVGNNETKQCVNNPEVVCWYEPRKWFLGIEISEILLNDSNLTISQGSAKLKKDRTENRYILSDVITNVSVVSSELPYKSQIPLGEKEHPYLLFKLCGQEIEQGRLIRFTSQGTYLVVVPDGWELNKGQQEFLKEPPAPCCVAEFKAHRIDLDSEEEQIVFTTSQGVVKIPNRYSRFELVGKRLNDASERIGPLFAEKPPGIGIKEGSSWQDIKTIVIGEEGGRKQGWRNSFEPTKEERIQELGKYLENKNGGWYFIRIYGNNQDLVESFDFRFATTLKNITIQPPNPFPGENGHSVVKVDIQHSRESSIDYVGESRKELTTKEYEEGTYVQIPPNPNYDKTDWSYQINDKSKINISILVERVWWSIGECSIYTDIKWTDKPCELSMKHLTATSKYLLKVRFPRFRWAKEVQIGFERTKARGYYVEVTKQEVEIPLNHFEGASEIKDFLRDHTLKLWIEDYPEQVIAILRKQTKPPIIPPPPPSYISKRLTVKCLLNYLNYLSYGIREETLSKMLKEYKYEWQPKCIRKKRDEFVLKISCLTKLAWNFSGKGRKKLSGSKKKLVRTLVRIANKNPEVFKAIYRDYEILNR